MGRVVETPAKRDIRDRQMGQTGVRQIAAYAFQPAAADVGGDRPACCGEGHVKIARRHAQIGGEGRRGQIWIV